MLNSSQRAPHAAYFRPVPKWRLWLQRINKKRIKENLTLLLLIPVYLLVVTVSIVWRILKLIPGRIWKRIGLIALALFILGWTVTLLTDFSLWFANEGIDWFTHGTGFAILVVLGVLSLGSAGSSAGHGGYHYVEGQDLNTGQRVRIHVRD